MNTRTITTLITMSMAATAASQDQHTGLHASLSDYEPLLGHWEVEGEWSMGFSMEGKTEYVPLLDGRMLGASTFVSDAGQPIYERYWSVMRALPGGDIEATHFGYDGTVNTVVHVPVETEAGIALDATWEMDGPQDSATIDERLVVGQDTCPWTVKITPAGMSDPIGGIETEWTRCEAFDRPSERPDTIMDEGLAPLAGLLGMWTIDATWADGSKLEATNEYRVGVGGMFIEVDTYPSDNGDDVYHRYHVVYDYDPETESVTAYGFDKDGNMLTLPVSLNEDGNGYTTLTEQGGMELRQSLTFTDADTLHWLVRMRPVGSENEGMVMMDAEWKRSD